MLGIARFSILLAGLSVAPAFAASPSLEGVWQSQGYGNVYQICGAKLSGFEVTAETCVRGFTAKRLTVEIPGREASFKIRQGGTFVISAGIDDAHKLLKSPDGFYSIRIERLTRLPSLCDAPMANTPLGNFDLFARTFAEHYIGLDVRNVDWDKLVNENRQKVTPKTTPAELFDVFVSMLKPLGDLHTGIEAPSLKRESPDFFRPGTDRVIKGGIEYFATKGRRALFRVTDRAHLQGPVRNFCKGQIQFGRVNKTTGYLRILSFGDYAKFGKDSHALESALDRIFLDTFMTALIIDVRLSFGGDDQLGRVIESRLTNADYPAYAIQARSDPLVHDKWTIADEVLVRRSSRPGFMGPVVELIGPITMSAAENLTLALMGRTPRVTRIGENTQGVFCDVLDRHLPNGWKFGLPNAVHRTAQATAFDAVGVPPDIKVAVFADEDVAAGRDPGMAMALQILNETK